MQQRNRCINVLKGGACILVVLNHFHWNGLVGDIIYTISHLGVPIFFMTSGFFMTRGGIDQTLKKLPRKILHVWNLFLAHLILYFYDFLFEVIFVAEQVISKADVLCQIRSIFKIDAIKNTIKWSCGLYGIGQWFLIALLEVYIFIYLLYKLRLGKILERYSLILSCSLFIFHIPIRLLIVKSGITIVWGMDTSQTAIVRNALFDALPFVLFGIWLKNNIETIKFSNKKLLVTALIAAWCSIFEYFVTKWIVNPYEMNCVLYIGTIISSCCLFIYAARNGSGIRNSFLEYVGSKLSMIIYFIHPLVGKYILLLIGAQMIYKKFFPIIIVMVSVVTAHIVHSFLSSAKEAEIEMSMEHIKRTDWMQKESIIIIISSFGLLFSMLS